MTPEDAILTGEEVVVCVSEAIDRGMRSNEGFGGTWESLVCYELCFEFCARSLGHCLLGLLAEVYRINMSIQIFGKRPGRRRRMLFRNFTPLCH